MEGEEGEGGGEKSKEKTTRIFSFFFFSELLDEEDMGVARADDRAVFGERVNHLADRLLITGLHELVQTHRKVLRHRRLGRRHLVHLLHLNLI